MKTFKVIRIFYDDNDVMRTAIKLLSEQYPDTDVIPTMMDQLSWVDVTSEIAADFLQEFDSKFMYPHITSVLKICR